jgi:hypothetical protein
MTEKKVTKEKTRSVPAAFGLRPSHGSPSPTWKYCIYDGDSKPVTSKGGFSSKADAQAAGEQHSPMLPAYTVKVGQE